MAMSKPKSKKIGVDLRALQIGHQYRGVGEVVKRTLNGIFELAVGSNELIEFVFFEYDDPIDPKEFLELPAGLQYRTLSLGKRPTPDVPRTFGEKLRTKWQSLVADPIPEAKGCNVFLQYDYALGVPLRVKTVLVKHDLIPYIFWNDYFESAWVPFKNKAARTTLRTLFTNYEFKRVLTRSLHNAKTIVCVSDSTRRDLKRYFHIADKKMRTILLGVSQKPLASKTKVDESKLPSKPYLLFVGGIDGRRRAVGDLVAAFNNLKADGNDLQLALVGENFKSVDDIPNVDVRRQIKQSSYSKDILCLGYIDDATKQDLYKNAVAFVFPTLYEGFGIPVLEAMLMECPVIAYKNSSIPEVGGKHVLYAHRWDDIQKHTEYLLHQDEITRKEHLAAALAHARQYTWDKTAHALYDVLKQV
jgi:glycosyltransferase involved in cell wall biosynthesis